MKLSSIKKIVLFISCILSSSIIYGQALGSWKAYMAYQKATMVTEVSDGSVYAIYEGEPQKIGGTNEFGSLLRYRLDNNKEEVKLLSKVDGLNDVVVSQIAYCTEQKILLVAYETGNIDLINTETQDIFNISSLKSNTNVSDKTINSINVFGKNAYLCMNFGIIVIDIERMEMKNKYELKNKVSSVCLWGDYIYAATDQGIFRGEKSKNLTASSNWSYYPLSYNGNDKNITQILTFKNQLVFYQPGNGVYKQDLSSTISAVSTIPNTFNQITTLQNQLILLGNDSKIYFYSDFTAQPDKIVSTTNSTYISSLNNSNIYWLAQGNNGICRLKKETNEFSNGLKIDSPKRNLFFYMTYKYGKLLTVGGNAYVDNQNYNGTFIVWDNQKWFNADERSIQQTTGKTCRDFMCAVVDPKDPNHYFVSSFGEGLYEFKDNKFVNLYYFGNTNNAIQAVITNNPKYVRLGGLAYDKDNNLFILNENVIPNQIVVYNSSNNWNSLYYNNLPRIRLLKDIVITKNNQKWINAPRENAEDKGLFVIDDKGTFDTNDDVSVFAVSFKDQDGETIDIANYNTIIEDRDGTIWVGTNIGPIIFYNPTQITKTGNFSTCSRPKVPLNDGENGAFYLLDGITINSIAVDGGNRKWIGTNGSGVYLVSPTGDKIIANYTAENSPLLSNVVRTIAINDENGEIFIGTDKGLISYTNLATEGKVDYSNVYAYPNPVKPDFMGDVVVTGLIENSNVKITDLSGNIIQQGISVGGQFSWDCKYQGKKVKTGVYLVFATNEDGLEGVVTKIVVVK